MGLDVGAVHGALELQSNWDSVLRTATASQQTFASTVSSSMAGVSASTTAAEKALARMEDSLSGGKVIREATLMAEVVGRIGGMSQLTARELEKVGAQAAEAAEKMRALGVAVPPSVQRIATAFTDAQEKIARFKEEAERTNGSFANFAKGLDIEGLISNPAGAAKGAMVALAESVGGVAVVAATAVTGVVAIGTALFELASHAAAVGAQLDDMADKTGLSVPALSRLSNAAQVIGADMGTLTDVVAKLERGIGENTEKFQAGLAKMGLSTAALKAAGPDQYLELITAGLKGLVDPSERAAAGTAVLGRGFKDVAAALNDLDAGFKATSDLTPWTKEQAAQAEAFQQKIAALELHVKAAGLAIGAELIPVVSLLTDGFVAAGKSLATVGVIGDVVTGFRLAHDTFGAAADISEVLAKKVRDLKDAMGELPPPVKESSDFIEKWATRLAGFSWGNLAHEAILDVAAGVRVLAHDLGTLPEVGGPAALGLGKVRAAIDGLQFHATTMSVKEQDDAIKAMTAQYEKWQGVVADVEAAGDGWKGTLKDIDAWTLQNMRDLAAAGVPLQSIIAYYGQGETVGKAFTLMLASEKKALEDVAKAQTELNAISMTVYAGQIATLKNLEAQRAKSYGTEEQIAMLQRLAVAEDDLTRHVLTNLTSEKDRAKVREEAAKAQAEIAAQIAALDEKQAVLRNAGVLEATRVQIAYNKSLGLDAKGAIAVQETALTVLTERLAEIAAMHTTVAAKAILSDAANRDYTKSLYDQAVAADKARDALAGMTGARSVPAGWGAGDTSTWGVTGQKGVGGFGPTVTFGGARAFGGDVQAGKSYLVGDRADRQPEIFTPGASGFITPQGGGDTVVHITVQGSVIAEREFTQRVGAALMQQAKAGRKFGAG